MIMETKLELPYEKHLAFQADEILQMSLPDTFGFNETYNKLKFPDNFFRPFFNLSLHAKHTLLNP